MSPPPQYSPYDIQGPGSGGAPIVATPGLPLAQSAQPVQTLDQTGQQVDVASEDWIESHLPGRPVGDRVAVAHHGEEWSFGDKGPGPGSRQVGWVLQRAGRVVASFAFSINPQAITRSDTTRTQLQATQGGFFVDDFGAGPTTIQLTQLVATGRNRGGARATMREDVLNFYDQIYVQAASIGPAQADLYFYDSHLYDKPQGRAPERVYFPTNAFSLTRSVSQHNVWQLQVTMVTLENPNGTVRQQQRRRGAQVHVVQKGETLHKIARQSLGKTATHQQFIKRYHEIIALTRKYGGDDITKPRTVQLFGTDPTQPVGVKKVSRNHIVEGERIYLPSR